MVVTPYLTQYQYTNKGYGPDLRSPYIFRLMSDMEIFFVTWVTVVFDSGAACRDE